MWHTFDYCRAVATITTTTTPTSRLCFLTGGRVALGVADGRPDGQPSAAAAGSVAEWQSWGSEGGGENHPRLEGRQGQGVKGRGRGDKIKSC